MASGSRVVARISSCSRSRISWAGRPCEQPLAEGAEEVGLLDVLFAVEKRRADHAAMIAGSGGLSHRKGGDDLPKRFV